MRTEKGGLVADQPSPPYISSTSATPTPNITTFSTATSEKVEQLSKDHPILEGIDWWAALTVRSDRSFFV